jgi:hypothetical protein
VSASAAPTGGGDDEDLNDVTAMGGVNLQEEAKQIMAASGELMATETRRLPAHVNIENCE